MRLAVLASGSGTILDAICDAGVPVAVVVRRPAVRRPATWPSATACRVSWSSAAASDATSTATATPPSWSACCSGWDIDLVVMAGFGTILGKAMFDAFPGRILNTHPALLPSFPGWHGGARTRSPTG